MVVSQVVTAAVVATSLSAMETTLSLLSDVGGVPAVMAAVAVAPPLPTEAVLSLTSITFNQQGLKLRMVFTTSLWHSDS